MLQTKAFDIRPATLGDKYEIARLGKEFLKESDHLDRLGFDWEVFLKFLEASIANEAFFVQVAEVDEEVVGFMLACLSPSYFSGAAQATELVWYINKNYRKSRIAARLQSSYEEWAREEGAVTCSVGHLVTPQSERIAKLYSRRGYDKVETTYTKELN